MPSNLRFLYDVGQIIPGTNYKVLAHLGIGGMGSVYEVAEPTRDDQPFVLKAVHPQLLAGTCLRERLFKEAATLCQLQHDNIVRVLGSGETTSDPAIPYYVMERLRGHTLGRALRRLRAKGRWLPLSRAFTIMAGVLSALAHAHELNVIHRDVKAENIFLHQRSDGRICIKLVDFGMTQVLGEARSAASGFVGSVAGAAPELLRSEELTPACDIYAAGVLLYEMLCWHHPFGEFGDDRELVEAHLSSEPVPLSTWRAVPQALDELILRMLEKDPKRRPDGASALSSLDRIRRELSRTNTLELYDPPSAKMPIAPVVLSPSATLTRADVWESPTGHLVGGPGQSPADLERAELASVPPASPEAAQRLTPFMAADGSMGIRSQPATGAAPSGPGSAPGAAPAPAAKATDTPPWSSGREKGVGSPPRPTSSPPRAISSQPRGSTSPPRNTPPPPSVPILPEPQFDNGPATDPGRTSRSAGQGPYGGSGAAGAGGEGAVSVSADPPVSPHGREIPIASPSADTEVSKARLDRADHDRSEASEEEPAPSSRPAVSASSSAVTLPRNVASSRSAAKLRWWLHPDANQPVPDWVQAAAQAAPRPSSRLSLFMKKAAASIGMGVTLAFLVLAPTSGLWWPARPILAGANVSGPAAAPEAPVALAPVEVHSQRLSNTPSSITATGGGVAAAGTVGGNTVTAGTVSSGLAHAVVSSAASAIAPVTEARAPRRAAENAPPIVGGPAVGAAHGPPRDSSKPKPANKIIGRELMEAP